VVAVDQPTMAAAATAAMASCASGHWWRHK
jgi:hypothetical protein